MFGTNKYDKENMIFKMTKESAKKAVLDRLIGLPEYREVYASEVQISFPGDNFISAKYERLIVRTILCRDHALEIPVKFIILNSTKIITFQPLLYPVEIFNCEKMRIIRLTMAIVIDSLVSFRCDRFDGEGKVVVLGTLEKYYDNV